MNDLGRGFAIAVGLCLLTTIACLERDLTVMRVLVAIYIFAVVSALVHSMAEKSSVRNPPKPDKSRELQD